MCQRHCRPGTGALEGDTQPANLDVHDLILGPGARTCRVSDGGRTHQRGCSSGVAGVGAGLPGVRAQHAVEEGLVQPVPCG
jgi:hypothetical protein